MVGILEFVRVASYTHPIKIDLIAQPLDPVKFSGRSKPFSPTGRRSLSLTFSTTPPIEVLVISGFPLHRKMNRCISSLKVKPCCKPSLPSPPGPSPPRQGGYPSRAERHHLWKAKDGYSMSVECPMRTGWWMEMLTWRPGQLQALMPALR